MAWSGQFNLDFLGMLLLSGFWVAWRQCFSVGGIALGLLAVCGGVFFLSGYLLIESCGVGSDARALVLGERRFDS